MGRVIIHTSFFEQGTGTYTTLRQIVAEEMQCNPEEIQIHTLDTDSGVAADTGLGGSRGTRVASGAAFQAARAAREELLKIAASEWACKSDHVLLKGRNVIESSGKKQRAWSDLLAHAGRSVFGEALNKDDDHSPVTAFAAQVAEVSVDPETGQVTLRRLTTAHDTGVIMNPIGHQGQIDGGVVQGIGYGLIEYLPVQDGRVQVANFGEYKIPTIADIPALKTVIVASAEGVGPYNVKGIGENPISPAAPAIANAIEDAVGVRIKDLPITAEKIYAALRGGGK
jgi:CO/xanthine dehydrogenase Mo-binding subunit